MANKTIQLDISIFKENRKEFTETEVDELMDDFIDFLESKGLMSGGGHELV